MFNWKYPAVAAVAAAALVPTFGYNSQTVLFSRAHANQQPRVATAVNPVSIDKEAKSKERKRSTRNYGRTLKELNARRNGERKIEP